MSFETQCLICDCKVEGVRYGNLLTSKTGLRERVEKILGRNLKESQRCCSLCNSCEQNIDAIEGYYQQIDHFKKTYLSTTAKYGETLPPKKENTIPEPEVVTEHIDGETSDVEVAPSWATICLQAPDGYLVPIQQSAAPLVMSENSQVVLQTVTVESSETDPALESYSQPTNEVVEATCGKESEEDNVHPSILDHTGMAVSIQPMDTSEETEMMKGLVPKPSFACAYCNSKFDDSESLLNHEHTTGHNSNYNYKCGICGNIYARVESLRDHMCRHTGQKPHKCEVCGEGFSYRNQLSRHRVTHFQILEGTGQSLILTKENLNLEIQKSNTENKENNTESKILNISKDLAQGIQNIIGSGESVSLVQTPSGEVKIIPAPTDRKVSCPKCHENFPSQVNLRKHQCPLYKQVPSQEHAYQCPKCKLAFDHRLGLERHRCPALFIENFSVRTNITDNPTESIEEGTVDMKFCSSNDETSRKVEKDIENCKNEIDVVENTELNELTPPQLGGHEVQNTSEDNSSDGICQRKCACLSTFTSEFLLHQHLAECTYKKSPRFDEKDFKLEEYSKEKVENLEYHDNEFEYESNVPEASTESGNLVLKVQNVEVTEVSEILNKSSNHSTKKTKGGDKKGKVTDIETIENQLIQSDKSVRRSLRTAGKVNKVLEMLKKSKSEGNNGHIERNVSSKDKKNGKTLKVSPNNKSLDGEISDRPPEKRKRGRPRKMSVQLQGNLNIKSTVQNTIESDNRKSDKFNLLTNIQGSNSKDDISLNLIGKPVQNEKGTNKIVFEIPKNDEHEISDSDLAYEVMKDKDAIHSQSFINITKSESKLGTKHKESKKLDISPGMPKVRSRIPKSDKFHCEVCVQSFSCLAALQKHKNSRIHKRGLNTPSNRKYQCMVCGRGFKKLDHLRDHSVNHTGELPHACLICNEKFKFRSQLAKHRVAAHTQDEIDNALKSNPQAGTRRYRNSHFPPGLEKDNPIYKPEVLDPLEEGGKMMYRCQICSSIFVQRRLFNRHVVSHYKVKPFKCEVCSKEFARADTLRNHKKVHYGLNEVPNEEGLFLCDTCGRQFPKVEALRNHVKIHNEQREWKCSHCNKTFVDKHNLDRHITIHSTEKPFLCATCGQGFNRKSHLEVHEAKHSGIDLYQCDICDRTFNEAGNLQRHMAVHSDSRPWPCPTCGERFKRKGNLDEHLVTHSLERHAVCEVCGTSFTTQRYLKIHQRIHTGERPHKCAICKASFRQMSALVTHKRIHTGHNPYKCTKCEKRFKYYDQWKAHEYSHTDAKPYKCLLCNASYRQAGSLRQHRKLTHGNQKLGMLFLCALCNRTFPSTMLLERHMKWIHDAQATLQSIKTVGEQVHITAQGVTEGANDEQKSPQESTSLVHVTNPQGDLEPIQVTNISMEDTQEAQQNIVQLFNGQTLAALNPDQVAMTPDGGIQFTDGEGHQFIQLVGTLADGSQVIDISEGHVVSINSLQSNPQIAQSEEQEDSNLQYHQTIQHSATEITDAQALVEAVAQMVPPRNIDENQEIGQEETQHHILEVMEIQGAEQEQGSLIPTVTLTGNMEAMEHVLSDHQTQKLVLEGAAENVDIDTAVTGDTEGEELGVMEVVNTQDDIQTITSEGCSDGSLILTQPSMLGQEVVHTTVGATTSNE